MTNTKTGNLTIEKLERCGAVEDGSEAWIVLNGENVGTLTKHMDRHNWCCPWEVSAYTIDFDAGNGETTKEFSVKSHGSARKAVNAAKAWARANIA
mgnify:CR=1 FL=1